MGLSSSVDITAEQNEVLHSFLADYLPDTEVWIYGSRVQGKARVSSDLDMVVFATPEQRSNVSLLREAFDESNLAFRVDLFIWDEVPESFRETIKKQHFVLQKPTSNLPTE